jgi:hypothetical protein
MSDTPKIDEVEKYSGVTIKDSVTTCGDESSSVYIPVIFARQLERERNKWRVIAKQTEDEWVELKGKLNELEKKLYSITCHENDLMDLVISLNEEIKQLKNKHERLHV